MGDPFVQPGLQYEPHVEQVLLQYEGTMSLTTTKDDWLRAQHRDTLCTLLADQGSLNYLAMIENVAPARVERELMERLADPLRK